jgi:hypothetical protein
VAARDRDRIRVAHGALFADWAVATPTPPPPIPPGYRLQIPRLRIDLAIIEGDIERDAVALQTPEGYAFHLPGTATDRVPAGRSRARTYVHRPARPILSSA